MHTTNDYRLDNPMTDTRFDPKPTESPTIECTVEVQVVVKFRATVTRPMQDGEPMQVCDVMRDRGLRPSRFQRELSVEDHKKIEAMVDSLWSPHDFDVSEAIVTREIV